MKCRNICIPKMVMVFNFCSAIGDLLRYIFTYYSLNPNKTRYRNKDNLSIGAKILTNKERNN